ncbi:MAG: hypothetical protein OEW91_08995, partial [Acidimicrobiia bacterium]|nr:hypothetical protein [Acidimicrobiia bacterium]
HIAQQIDIIGLSAVENQISELVKTARSRGVNPLLTQVLSDPTEPEIARLRAFARIRAEFEANRTPVLAA